MTSRAEVTKWRQLLPGHRHLSGARWAAYANDGHGGNRLLKARQPSNYSISILEVASPDMAARDVVHEVRETRGVGEFASGQFRTLIT